MAARIKCNVFNLLFRLFSFLADKTGGWQLFVKPKLILGALILSISVSSCNTIPDTLDIYNYVEQLPEFPGGNFELFEFIHKNLNYPVVMCYEGGGVQGRVACRFVVHIDGSISDIEILQSLDRYTDREAVRLIQSMPKWIPGKQNGEDVNARFILPITFRLQ